MQCAQCTYVTHVEITLDVQNYINMIADALRTHDEMGKGGCDTGCASLTERRGMLHVLTCTVGVRGGVAVLEPLPLAKPPTERPCSTLAQTSESTSLRLGLGGISLGEHDDSQGE